jgi:hypothetical protein
MKDVRLDKRRCISVLRWLGRCETEAALDRVCKGIAADRPLARRVVMALKGTLGDERLAEDIEIARHVVERLETSLIGTTPSAG